MDIKSKIEIACTGCGKIDVKHYAKKMCYNCYANAYYHKKAQSKTEETEVPSQSVALSEH